MDNPLLYTIGDEIVDVIANLETNSRERMFANVVNGFVVPEKSRPIDFPLACVFYGDGSFGGDNVVIAEYVDVELNIIAYFHIIDPEIAQNTMMDFHSKMSQAIIDRANNWEYREVSIRPTSFGFGDVLRRNFGITEIPLLPPFYGVHINLAVHIVRSSI